MIDPQKTLREAQRAAEEARKRVQLSTEELDRRQMDSVRLYSPMPAQEAFHRSKASVRIIRAGNRSGKTYAVCQEVARAVRRLDPHKKYPSDQAIIVWMIVFEQDNIGRTLYRTLFKPGCGDEVWIIRDLATGKYRTWKPNDPSDAARKKERIPAPPLIPKEEIKGDGKTGGGGFSWVSKGPRIFKVCRLKNGSEIRTFCSGSEPPMGDSVDLAVIDEDLKQDRKMISELMARTATRGGKIIWSVWPKTKNSVLQKLCKEASNQAGQPDPDVEEFRMRFSHNEYVSQADKLKTIRLWATQGEDVVRSRDMGDFGMDAIKMYPEFSMDVHGIPNVSDPKSLDRQAYQGKIDWFLRTRKIPDDWARFMWIDPGYTVTAVVFFAVSPPEIGDCVVAYDELHLCGYTVVRVVEAIAMKAQGNRFHAFGMDFQHGRKHDQATGKTQVQQFIDEFKRRGVRSATTGSSFRRGSTNIQG